eukprot:TRINITY_DN70960_c0_g2_i2.p1 TRINITY_DN70960_c0_g2~~TRINITY_DN70960_c0_g2_i2.p1  ORF type:complete len:280 (-),score=8.19 TRINITY_DN70960_c0_g2_i2:14-853(-)
MTTAVQRQHGPLTARLLQYLRQWLQSRLMCWGLGPVLALWVGTLPPMVFLELALRKGWFARSSLIEYLKDKGATRQERVRHTQSTVPFAEQLKGAMYTLGPSAAVNAIISYFLLPRVIRRKPTELLPSLSSFIGSFLAMYTLGDFFLYWGHRVQHEVPFLWTRCHSLHHTLLSPTPVSTVYIDPVDATLQAGLPLILSAAAVQPHPITFYACIAFRTCENVVNHSGVDNPLVNFLMLKGLPLRAGVSHHDYCTRREIDQKVATATRSSWAFLHCMFTPR